MLQREMKEMYNVKTMTQIAMLIALSAIGATIKVQGSIAFDSMAGFFAALYINPMAGALVGLLGHLLSSAMAAFPLTLPMHIFVALQMFAVIYVFGFVYERTSSLIAIVVGTLLNGPIATLAAAIAAVVMGLPFSGWPLFVVMWIPLTVASFFNILLAVLIYKKIEKRQ